MAVQRSSKLNIMKATTYICGVPLFIEHTGRLTLITSKVAAELSPIQRRIITGWLRQKGNVVVHSDPGLIQVAGLLTPGTIATKTE